MNLPNVITPAKNYQFIAAHYNHAKRQQKALKRIEKDKGKESEEWRKFNSERLKGIGLEGASRCFVKNTKVITLSGVKNIQDVSTLDKVLSFNFKKGKKEFRRVEENHSFPNNKKNIITIKFKDGRRVSATEDHEFFYKGAWIELRHLVTLWYEMEENTKLQPI